MRIPTLLLLLSAWASAQEAPATSPETSDVSSDRLNRCATLGFDADALDCRLCEELSTFLTKSTKTKSATKLTKTKSVDLVTHECRDCCSDLTNLLEAEGRRYPQAVLALSRRRLKRYPKLANFVEHQAEQIKGLQVQETDNRLPMLQFFDEDGEKVQEVSVAHWDEASIAEFIGNKLLPEEEEGDEVVEIVEEVVEMEVEADKP
ncbi:hypothetical protein PRIC1_004883 [Phytophthora ramorum]